MLKFSFEESKHPRDKDGQFASKGGGGAASGSVTNGGKKKRGKSRVKEFVAKAAVLAGALVYFNHTNTKFRRRLRQSQINKLKSIGFKDHHIAHAMRKWPEEKASIFERGVRGAKKLDSKLYNPFSEKNRSLKKILKGTGKVKFKFKKAAADASKKYTIYDAGLNPRFD